MGFADSIKATASKMQGEVNKKIVDVSTELFRTIVIKTPVGKSNTKGQLKNNWWLGVGKGNINHSYTLSFQPAGTNSFAQVARLKTTTPFLARDNEVTLTNSVPYAIRAEYIGWPTPRWSGTVGPYAMVRNSLLQVASKYRT